VKYTIVIEPETNPDFQGFFTAYCPALPGCATYGKSIEEAQKNIREAIWLYLENLQANGRPIPED